MVRVDESVPLMRMSGVQFGEANGRALLLDAVAWQDAAHAPKPAVIFVHGGGFSEGTREDDWFSPYLASHGFFAVSIDYRLSGEAPFPAQIHDVKAAIRWLRANAETYNIDPDRIGIWGTSAGGHLAALAGLTGDLPELEGDSGSAGYSSKVQAVAIGSGASDFLREGGDVRRDSQTLQLLFDGTGPDKEKLMRLASPVSQVTTDAPPFLLVHGTHDETVPFEQGEVLYDALISAGIEAELIPLVNRTHSWTARIDPPDEDWRYWELAPMALPFFVKHLRPWKRNGSRL